MPKQKKRHCLVLGTSLYITLHQCRSNAGTLHRNGRDDRHLRDTQGHDLYSLKRILGVNFILSFGTESLSNLQNYAGARVEILSV